jgi:transposase
LPVRSSTPLSEVSLPPSTAAVTLRHEWLGMRKRARYRRSWRSWHLLSGLEGWLQHQAYNADAIRKDLANDDIEAVIPAKSNRRNPAPHDRAKYRWRNQIERLFNKLKNWRRIATRYDKTAQSYISFVGLASVLLWLPLSTKPSRLLKKSLARL